MDSPTKTERRSGVFVAAVGSLDPPYHLEPAITAAVAATTETLVVVLVSPLFELPQTQASISRTQQWDAVQRLFTYVYAQATRAAQDNGRILMDISVLLKASLSAELAIDMNVCFLVDGGA